MVHFCLLLDVAAVANRVDRTLVSLRGLDLLFSKQNLAVDQRSSVYVRKVNNNLYYSVLFFDECLQFNLKFAAVEVKMFPGGRGLTHRPTVKRCYSVSTHLVCMYVCVSLCVCMCVYRCVCVCIARDHRLDL